MNTPTVVLSIIGIGIVLVAVGSTLVRTKNADSSIATSPTTTAATTSSIVAVVQTPKKERFWESFIKPSDAVLRQTLTPLQYQVTQKDGTERAYKNEYADNHEEGIYVDRISGEPLYSSKDKYDSGTGWPSFVNPIAKDVLVFKTDGQLIFKRTEVRSQYADSHLGHVFDDGPADRGGKRYCMNSAALRFIPKASMQAEGYGDYLSAL